jgi:hypothetical protein
MKNLIASLITCSVLMITFSSCKKDKDPTLQDRVSGKWLIENYEYNDHFNGTDHPYVMTGTAAEYMDFRKDGKMYYYFGGGHDTLSYTMVSETKMILDGVNCDIKTFTDKNFKFYYRQDSGADYEENTLTLKR